MHYVDNQVPEVRFIGVTGIPEISPGDPLSSIILGAVEAQGTPLQDGDVLIVTQKIVSKAEGQIVDLSTVVPSDFAKQFADGTGRDPRVTEVVLQESAAIVRMDLTRGILITETHHGFVCANAGVDSSNVEGEDHVTLLPRDPDASAQKLLDQVNINVEIDDLAIIISDTFGRAWREGHVNFAIGVAGMDPFIDYRGEPDSQGQEMGVTRIAIADEIAASAELVMGKVDEVPIAIARGVKFAQGEHGSKYLLRDRSTDLFR